jgi:hypothetical protein
MNAQLKPVVDQVDAATDDLITRVRANLEAIIASGESRATIAREAGVSGSRLGQFLAGDYTGDIAGTAATLDTWLKSRLAREHARLPNAPAFFETPTTARISTALAYAQLAGDLAAIYGAAGVGKTVTIEHYAETNPNVWVAVMSSATSSVVTALEEVCAAVGLREMPGGGGAGMQRSLIRRLRGTHGLLVVDEAQHLSVAALEALRHLHDKAGVGLVLAGNETVYARLTGGNRQATFAQLFSRIGKRVRLARPTDDDVRALLGAWSVSGREERDVATRIAATPGGLRGLTKTLRLGSMLAGRRGVTAKEMRAAWRDLGGEA